MNLLINNTDCAVHSRAIASAIAKNTNLNGVEAIVAAEFIQQLHYWTEKGAGILKEEVQWIYNTYEQWIDTQFPSLSKYYLRKIKNALISSGLILVKKLRDKQWNQTYYYALKYDALLDLEELKPLKNSKVNTVDHQRSTVCIIDDQHSESSYTKSTSIEDLQKEKNTDQENKIRDSEALLQADLTSDKEKDPPLDSYQEKRPNPYSCSVISSDFNSPGDKEVPQVEEKINKNKNTTGGQRFEETSKLRPMNEDRYFPVKNQQSEIKERAKMDSAVGMSGFKDVEDLRECQKQLTLYFAKQLEPTKAAEKASWIIKAERQGERSPFVQDYLDGVAIGSWCKKDWEIEPGVIFPVFASYLRDKLRRDGDTREQVNVKIHWYLKDDLLVKDAWAECKRLIDVEKPRLIQAKQLGQNLSSLKIPAWIIDSFREEVAIADVVDTAETLGAIAIQYNQQTEQSRKQLQPGVQDIPVIDENSSPLAAKAKAILNSFKFLGSQEINDRDKQQSVDRVMDRVAEDSVQLDENPSLEEEEKPCNVDEIDSLLNDPVTRARGIALAKKQDLPLLLNDDGVAIALLREEKNIGYGAAPQIYQPEQIEKGSKSAWEEAISKSKFLSKRAKSGNR